MNLINKNIPKRTMSLQNTRNIGIAAHIDAGKTTTTERMLFYTGVLHKMGEVHEGSAFTDWMEQEKERGITITSAAISCMWTPKNGPFSNIPQKINIIDTPGHVDFTAEVERSLRVLDGAIAIFCGVAGVQPQSETVWRQMNKYHVPRLAFVNKMDRSGANFLNIINDIRTKFKCNAHPLYLNMGSEENFNGIIDLIRMISYTFDVNDKSGIKYIEESIPTEYVAIAKNYREKLIEALADLDDDIAEKYLSDVKISEDDLKKAIRKATNELKFIGVIPGSSFKNKGVQLLLDGVIDYLPSPLESKTIKGNDLNKNEIIEIIPDDNHPCCALAFKLMTDSFVGKLIFVRIYSGIIKKGDILYNTRTRKKERISRLMLMKSDERQEIDIAYAGDICAIVGAKEIITGDTLCSKNLNILLEPPTFPEPVISMSIEPKSKADQEKLSMGLQRLSEEDPTFIVSSNNETGQTIISGMGELHLEIIKDRLFREFKVDANSGQPQIAYKETILYSAKGEGKFIRQSGGRGQYGHVILEIYPNERGKGIEIINKIIGGAIPKEFIKPTESGILSGALNGIVAGYPVIDFKAYILDGSFHEVDSSEIAFKMAAIFALKDALKKANSILLEPIVKVNVETPTEYQGDIIGDINKRRGKIQNIYNKNTFVDIECNVPLECMFGYATNIRSLSKGRATYTMETSHFEQVPLNLIEKISKNN